MNIPLLKNRSGLNGLSNSDIKLLASGDITLDEKIIPFVDEKSGSKAISIIQFALLLNTPETINDNELIPTVSTNSGEEGLTQDDVNALIAGTSTQFEALVTPNDFTTLNTVTLNDDFTVDWGDGNFIAYPSGSANSIASGNITIRSENPVSKITFDSDTFTDINLTLCSTITDMDSICSLLTILESFAANDTSNVTNMSYGWEDCLSLTSFPIIDTSSVIFVTGAWSFCDALLSFPLLDLSNCSDFDEAWLDCASITSFPAMDTSSGQRFVSTFDGCISLVCLTQLNTLSQTNTLDMFFGTTSLINPNGAEQTALLAGSNYVNAGSCP